MDEVQTPETWFKAPEQRCRLHSLRAPYDKIFIGPDPVDGFTEEKARSFQAIVNVSCSPCAYFHPAFQGQYMHWNPINEMGYWGLAPFYWFKKVMDFHHSKGHRVYVHCHAGAYRSPTFTIFWLTSLGHTYDEALEIEYNDPDRVAKYKTEEGGHHWRWKKEFPFKSGNVNYNTIPMLRKMATCDHSFGGILHHPTLEISRETHGRYVWHARRHHWFSFYYRPKWWLDRRLEPFRYWMKGQRYVRTSDYSGEVHPIEGRFAKIRGKVTYSIGRPIERFRSWRRSRYYRISSAIFSWFFKRRFKE